MPNSEELNAKMAELVDEVAKDHFNVEKVKSLTTELGIAYSDNHLQLLNNILKGIHTSSPKNEPQILR